MENEMEKLLVKGIGSLLLGISILIANAWLPSATAQDWSQPVVPSEVVTSSGIFLAWAVFRVAIVSGLGYLMQADAHYKAQAANPRLATTELRSIAWPTVVWTFWTTLGWYIALVVWYMLNEIFPEGDVWTAPWNNAGAIRLITFMILCVYAFGALKAAEREEEARKKKRHPVRRNDQASIPLLPLHRPNPHREMTSNLHHQIPTQEISAYLGHQNPPQEISAHLGHQIPTQAVMRIHPIIRRRPYRRQYYRFRVLAHFKARGGYRSRWKGTEPSPV